MLRICTEVHGIRRSGVSEENAGGNVPYGNAGHGFGRHADNLFPDFVRKPNLAECQS